MKLGALDLKPGMVLESPFDTIVILSALLNDDDEQTGWNILIGRSELDQARFSELDRWLDGRDLWIADHPNNVGHLYEMCREAYGPGCFFVFYRKSWLVYPRLGREPVGESASLCRSLMSALEAAP